LTEAGVEVPPFGSGEWGGVVGVVGDGDVLGDGFGDEAGVGGRSSERHE